MSTKNLFFILTLTFFSCGNNSALVEESFHQILQVSKEGPLIFFQEMITEDSKKYINGLIEMSDQLDYDKAKQFGNEYGNTYKLTTMKLHGEMLKYIPDVKMESPDSAFFSMVFLMKFTGTGVLGMATGERIRFKEVAKVRGDEAQVKVRIKADGNTNILTTYKFKKEDQRWKLNLMSTFTTEEKLLKQMLIRQSYKGNEAAFIADFIENTPEMIEFKYDSSMVK